MSSRFALPSIGGALTCATQLPSADCVSKEVRELGLTLTLMTVAGIGVQANGCLTRGH